MTSLAAAFEIPLSRMDCQTGDMTALSVSLLTGEVSEKSVIVKVGPGASATQMGLQLSFSAVVATRLEWANRVRT